MSITIASVTQPTATNTLPERECCLYTVFRCVIDTITAIFRGIIDLFRCIFCCPASNQTSSSATASATSQTNQISSSATASATSRTSPPPRSQVSPPPTTSEERLDVIGISKGPNYLKKAFELDLNNAREPSFNDAYFQALRNNPRHATLALAGDHRTTIHTYLQWLEGIGDFAPHSYLNAGEKTQVKRMLCAILNRLEEIRRVNNVEYTRIATTVFIQIAVDALGNCTHNLMPTLDDILTNLMPGTGGSLQTRVERALQTIRQRCFGTAVYNIIQRLPPATTRPTKPGDREYHTEHEANTRNYYMQSMFARFGLKKPLTENRYGPMALTGKHSEITAEFERLYSVTTIIDDIHSIINHPLDGSISRNQFSSWAQTSNRVQIDARGNTVISGTNIPMQNAQGHFDKRLVLEYLIEIGALTR